MNTTTLYVGLKIPDSTAITAKQTLKEMGFELTHLQRFIAYDLIFEGDKGSFEQDIAKVDVLVNANKNTSSFSLDDKHNSIIEVQEQEQGTALLTTIRDQIGITQLQKIVKKTVWVLDADKDKAEKIASALLYNPHYQSVHIQ